MMNHVTLIGNLTDDVELRETPNGVSVCRFTIGVSRKYPDGDGERQSDFFDCTAWRGLAETMAQYCKKGHKIAVGGSLQTRTYEDNQGVKRKVTDIIVNDVEFLTPKSQQNQQEERQAPRKKAALVPTDDDSDIPF